MGFMDWKVKTPDVLERGGVVGPDERLPWPQTAVMGVQHVIAMFGATVLAPILMGFNPNVAILMSGLGTLIFFLITGGKVPSYLGSSFAFIGVVIAATSYAGKGANANIGVALGGIIACGLVYTLIGALVQAVGTGWIERFMPPVTRKKISVPTPLIKIATFGSKPIRMGASTVAPNIAITCCTPITAVCGQGSRSSGAITPPCCNTSALFTRQFMNPILLVPCC